MMDGAKQHFCSRLLALCSLFAHCFAFCSRLLAFCAGPNGLGTPITDLCVITGKSKDIQAPVGYTKVEGDLNQGTGGNFVFLCYHRGQLAEPISELFTMGGKPSEVLAPPPGYAKIDADLNAGALIGEKITLCVRRARPIHQPRPQHVITDLYVVYDATGGSSTHFLLTVCLLFARVLSMFWSPIQKVPQAFLRLCPRFLALLIIFPCALLTCPR